MNLQESRNMKLFAEKFPDPHVVLVAFMNAAQTADQLAIPLHAYELVYPNRKPPDTLIFKSAQSIIDNALYNETVSFGLSLGISRQHLEKLAGAPPVLVREGDIPKAHLVTDYAITPPSEAARREAKVKREKDGGSTGLTGSVLKRHPDRVERFDVRYPKHWGGGV